MNESGGPGSLLLLTARALSSPEGEPVKVDAVYEDDPLELVLVVEVEWDV